MKALNKEKNDDGAIINPIVTLEAQDQIRKAVLSQSDVLARMLIENYEEGGEVKYQYVLNAEPSETFEQR
ncbi:Uncharacterised protein [Staphylococcus gallinarum]|uniref:Uncharacterized protein n=1 Tax=Staphylococcus gallinarum TaxID=1293 RepID=A0A380FEA4_STAGA|nr:Uncharacterised protein [Staphylococcus gallinarum]